MPLYTTVRPDSDGKCSPTPRSRVSRSACLRTQNMTRAVAGVRVGAPGTAVIQPAGRGQALDDHVVGPATVDVGHECDTAGVVLVGRVVQPLRVRLRHRASWTSSDHALAGRRRPCEAS